MNKYLPDSNMYNIQERNKNEFFELKKSKFAWTGRCGVRPTDFGSVIRSSRILKHIFEVPEPQGLDDLIRLNMTVFE